MYDNQQIKVFNNDEDLSKTTCDFIVDLAKKSIAKKGNFSIVLSGGKTPEKVYNLLALLEYQEQIDWQNTYVFFGDERCVPFDDDRNNAHVAKKLLLNIVDIPDANIYVIPVDLSPKEAAENYQSTIEDFFGNNTYQFDLILLGLGENAHTASLFPYTNVIDEQIDLVKEVYVEEQEMYRVTMTAPLINNALNILFLVTGKQKAIALSNVLNEVYQPNKFPAQIINPKNGNLIWFVDEDANALIKF